MADFTEDVNQPESNNFDNDFEKLDPFSPESTRAEEFVSSTSMQLQPDTPEEDLYRASHPEPTEPLVDFGDTSPMVVPTEPFRDPDPVQPVSSSTVEDISPPPPAATEKPKDKPSGGSPTGQWMKSLDPRVSGAGEDDTSTPNSPVNAVVDLLYWRDVKKTGVVFGSLLVVLLSLALFSVLSVIAYLSLAALTVTISFRVYKNVLGAVQKTGEGHPFKNFLEVDIALPEDKVHQLADVTMSHVTCTLRELRRLFLVEDMVDSIKFGLLLWVLTYIGAWFNGMTLIILGVVGAFSLPKVYETYQVQIDQYLDLVKTQVRNIVKQVQEKIPLPGKKKSE